MSANERPEIRAYRELETLVRHLGEELAAFRRRALTAETQLKESGGTHAPTGKARPGTGERVAELESENESLRGRLGRAEERVDQMMDRVRFLRQQLQAQAAGAATAGGGSRS